MRIVNALPSESVTSWVKVYGRFGRRSRRACRHWEQTYVVDGFDDGRDGRWEGRNTGLSVEADIVLVDGVQREA